MNRSQVSVKWNQTTSIKKQEESYSLCVCVCVWISYSETTWECEREFVDHTETWSIKLINRTLIHWWRPILLKLATYTHTHNHLRNEGRARKHACLHACKCGMSELRYSSNDVCWETKNWNVLSHSLPSREGNFVFSFAGDQTDEPMNVWMFFFCLYFTMSILTLCQWI